FRNPQGEEVAFQVVDPQTGQPYARIAGPNNGGVIGLGTINGRGYLDVTLPESSGQLLKDGQTIDVTGALSTASVTDLAPEFALNPVSGLVLDNNQPPVHLQGNVFRYWTNGIATTATVEITFLKETWSYQASNGEELFNQVGAAEDADGNTQTPAGSTLQISPVIARYIDIKFVAAAGSEITDEQLQALADADPSGIFDILRRDGDNLLPGPSIGDAVALGNGTVRYFFTGDFVAGTYTVLFKANGVVLPDMQERLDTFSVVTPQMNVAAPFAGNAPNGSIEIVAIDVNVLNAQQHSGQFYLDLIFKPSPGVALDYNSIDGDEFTLTINGDTYLLSGAPIPIEMAFNDDFILVAKALTGGDATIAKLEEGGITRFRYLITGLTAFTPGQVVLTFDANTWADKAGNGGTAGTFTFGVEGPTATVVSPANGGNIDIGELNNRNYIDVTFPAAPAGYEVDFTSIIDLLPEFALSGAGVGSIKIDGAQKPIVLGASQVRYWVSGKFATGDVTINFTPGSWSFTSIAARTPSATTITLDDPSFVTVNFDNIEAGFSNDPASILDLGAEFGLSYSGAGSIALVSGEAPLRIGTTNSYKFRVTGDFVNDGTQTVLLQFNADAAWSFTQDNHLPGTATLTNAGDFNGRTYVDIAVATSRDLTPGPTPLSFTNDLEIGDIQITGVGSNGVMLSGAPTVIAPGLYRFFIEGQFEKGAVNFEFAEGALVDDAGQESRAMVSHFTVQGATGSIQSPVNGGSIGILTQNNRGFIDVTFGFPGLDLGSIFDLDDEGNHPPEFTLNNAAIQLDARQLPALVSQTASTYTFRYWTNGTYSAGPITATLIPGSFTVNGNANTSNDTLTIANPSTANLTYIDVRYRATDGFVLDVDSITDADAEFGLFTDEFGPDEITSANPATIAPVRLTNTDTFRYFFNGSFEAGTVWVRFEQDSFQSVAIDGAGVDADGIGNLARTESFAVVKLTATAINPVAGNTVDSNLLNQRGYIDVSFTAPSGAQQIDLASVFDLDPEFEITVSSPADGTLAIDATQRPALIDAATNTFRYWYAGTFVNGEVQVTFTAGSATFLKADGETVALEAGSSTIEVEAANNLTYLDVRFQTAGGVALDADLILDLEHEFALSGAGLGAAALSDQAPTQLGSSTDGFDNDNDGQVDEADENV
ncbi:MAG TPA: hypothetical protein VK530_11010, partial [Candidatus Acidoferrum sp.]|nr:hypothetical protein [Candidatus Acidoferrum sp.]